jgi:hypothetical protein
MASTKRPAMRLAAALIAAPLLERYRDLSRRDLPKAYRH